MMAGDRVASQYYQRLVLLRFKGEDEPMIEIHKGFSEQERGFGSDINYYQTQGKLC